MDVTCHSCAAIITCGRGCAIVRAIHSPPQVRSAVTVVHGHSARVGFGSSRSYVTPAPTAEKGVSYARAVASRLSCLSVFMFSRRSRRPRRRAPSSARVVDGTKAALPGATVTATLIDTGRVYTTVTDERGEYRLRGLAAGPLQGAGGAVGLLHGDRARHRAAGRPEPHRCRSRCRSRRSRDADGHRRIAARRHQLHAGGRQRRSPADGRAAAAGPQLDGAGDAGQGHHRQRRRHHAGRARPRSSS